MIGDNPRSCNQEYTFYHSVMRIYSVNHTINLPSGKIIKFPVLLLRGGYSLATYIHISGRMKVILKYIRTLGGQLLMDSFERKCLQIAKVGWNVNGKDNILWAQRPLRMSTDLLCNRMYWLRFLNWWTERFCCNLLKACNMDKGNVSYFVVIKINIPAQFTNISVDGNGITRKCM